MPELPEVETIKNVLKPIVTGHKITKIDVLRHQTILGDANVFISSLENQTFLDITRIGKFLVFHLSNDKVFISHLRMEGKYYEVNENEDNTHYSRVVFHLDNKKKLCYDDSRCFGIMKLTSESNYLKEEEISKLGPEPFNINDVSFLMKKCKNKRLPIKTTLLDQTLMTGLGNIYVDETLYASNIHPLTPANLITKQEWETIIDNAKKILTIAIEMGGSTIKSYHPGKGIDGNFQTRIKIYGRKDEICPICGSKFRFTKVNGRGTTFCPHCQTKKGQPLLVGLTGKIASGKSLCLEAFTNKGYDTISSDAIVMDLYQNEEVTKKIEKLLKISFSDTKVNKDELRNFLLIHPESKKKLERFVHPLVKKEIKRFFKESKSPIKVAEVPLLFESKMESEFDAIIAIDTDESNQLSRLIKRNGTNGEFLKEINKTNKFEEYKNKVEFLINNSASKDHFIKEINKVICKLEENLN